MADSKRESREVGFKVTDGCGNEACYCDGSCREDKARDLTIKVTADVNDAITGFKALSRELREATKVAREMEQAYEDVEKAKDLREGNVIIDGKKVAKDIYEPIYATDFGLSTYRDLSEVPTEVLHEELSRRKRDE